VDTEAILLGENRDSLQAQVGGRPENANGNLGTIRGQQLAKRPGRRLARGVRSVLWWHIRPGL